MFWNVESMSGEIKPSSVIDFHQKEVYDIDFMKDTHMFGTVGEDGILAIWDVRDLKQPAMHSSASDNGLNALSFSPRWDYSVITGG